MDPRSWGTLSGPNLQELSGTSFFHFSSLTFYFNRFFHRIIMTSFLIRRVVQLSNRVLHSTFSNLSLTFHIIRSMVRSISTRFTIVTSRVAVRTSLNSSVRRFQHVSTSYYPLRIVNLRLQLSAHHFSRTQVELLLLQRYPHVRVFRVAHCFSSQRRVPTTRTLSSIQTCFSRHRQPISDMFTIQFRGYRHHVQYYLK